MPQIQPLSAELQKIAVNEAGEVITRIPQDLQTLKEWIETQPHLKARTDDQFLIQFLRLSKYSLERAKNKLDTLYAMKSKFPEFFNCTDIIDRRFMEIYRLGCFAPLSKPFNGNGPRIFVSRCIYDLNQHNVEELYRVANVMHEIMLMDDPYATINGIVYITDMSNVTAAQLLKESPNFLNTIFQYHMKALHFHIKGSYFLNVPSVAESLLKLIISHLSDKVKQVIHICNIEDLLKLVPSQYLPKDFGGESCSLDQEIQTYEKKFDQYREYFEQNTEFGTDESLRAGKQINFDNLFGTGGTFRKLNVD